MHNDIHFVNIITSFLNILNQLKEPLMQSKLLRKFRKYKLSVDEMIYNEARNNVQALIKDKKKNFCKKSYLKM